MTDNGMAGGERGTTVRQEFGADQMVKSAEVATSAMVAQAQAEVNAMYIVAMRQPRSEADARIKLLNACERPGLAAVAIYRKPVGKKKNEETGKWEQAYAEGLSVRFAEEAARAWKNIRVSSAIVSDDDQRRILRVTAVDLESNFAKSVDIMIEKVVEKRQLRDGSPPLRVRQNSFGDTVYLYPATEAEVLVKSNAEKSKAEREVILKLVPGDILDEARARIYATRANEDAKDPEAAKKAMCDAFAAIGVKPSMLEEYLGHPLDASTAAEVLELKAVYVALKDHDTSWTEVLGDRMNADGPKPNAKVEAAKAKVQEKLKNKREAKAAPAAAPEGREPGSDG
jgi:hypothetical protein